MRQRHNGEEACSSPPCQKRNDTTRRGIYPSSSRRNSKNATRRGITLPDASEDEKNKRYVPYYWGWARRPFPCPRHPPHRAFSMTLFFDKYSWIATRSHGSLRRSGHMTNQLYSALISFVCVLTSLCPYTLQHKSLEHVNSPQMTGNEQFISGFGFCLG